MLSNNNKITDNKFIYGYIYGISNNLIKKYYTNKKKRNYEKLDDNIVTFDNHLIKNDRLSIELAFLKKYYRKCVTYYYYEDKSITEISKILNISKEMVKYYLFKARNILKENLKMEKEFGRRSYLPDEVTFNVLYKNNTDESYENLFNRKLIGNILLACYYNPMSILEISIELGVACVYMEDEIELLLKSLARNEATTATNKTLKNDIKEIDFDDISIDTITDYLNLFNKLYIIENIPPFHCNIRSTLRLKQSQKHHFVDPSLPCALLNLTKEKLINNLELLGFLFESLVERDLYIYSESFNAKLYHYQDYKNNEIDAIIELEDGEWCGFEIKLGANQIDDAAANLININNLIIKEGGKPAQSLCVICGLSNAAYKRKDGVYVVPITSLKQ